MLADLPGTRRSWVALRGTVNLRESRGSWRRRLCTAYASRVPDACLLCDGAAGPLPNLCGECNAGLARLPWRTASRFAAFAYQPPISTLIHWMKFEANLPAALTLGTLLADAVSAGLAGGGTRLPDAILPVPLHRRRLRAWHSGFPARCSP